MQQVPQHDRHDRAGCAAAGQAKRLFMLPWVTIAPIGLSELSKLVSETEPAATVCT